VPTSLTAGQSFAVNITFQNTGQCAWVYGAGPGGYRLGSQNPENNTTWGFSRVDLAYNEVINPGQYKTFTLYATAPSTAGSYGWGWRMVREGVNWLGTPTNPTFTTISVASPLPTVNSFTASPQARWADDPPAALQWDCAGATSASISSNPTTGGSWPNQAPSGSVSLAPPVGDYTYTVVCTNSAGSASQSTKFSVADPDQLRLGSTVATADNVLSWTASTKIKCFSHYLENQGYNWITRQVKIVVWQDIHWCINTKTKVLACGTQACPLYRTYGHSDPGFPWSWDSWDGSCAAGDCTDYKPLGAFSANIWMTGHIHSCLNVPFVGQVLCKNKSLTVRTIVYGDGTHSDEVIGP
jgi:hypothetical protein